MKLGNILSETNWLDSAKFKMNQHKLNFLTIQR